MKNKLLIALLLLSSASFGQSKSTSVKWGPELEGSRRGSVSDYMGEDETGYYLSAYIKSDLLIEKLDRNMGNPTNYTFEEKDKETKEKYELEGRRFFANKLWVFKSNIDKHTKTNTLLAQEVNKKSLTETGPLKKITEFQFEKRRDRGDFLMIASPSEKYMMIVEVIPTDKEENEQFNVVMLDSTLKQVWRKNIQLPYLNSLFFRNNFICDDDGNFYVLGKLYKDKVKAKVKGEVNFLYHLLAFNDNGNNKIDYEVKLQGNYITDITMTKNDKGEIVCAGFYSKKGFSSIDGAFYLDLDPTTKSVKVSNIKEFDMEFMTQYMTESQAKRAQKRDDKGKDQELFQYDLRNIIKRSDGGAILVGEQFYTVTHTYPCGNSYCSSTNYYYNDIIVVNINPQGKIEWATKIPKMQVSTNDGGFYSSFALAVTGEKLHFIYNDHKDNLDAEKTKRLKNFQVSDRNGIVVNATVDNAGKVTREQLLENTETEVIVRPKVCDQIDDSHMLIFGERKKIEQFGMVTFK